MVWVVVFSPVGVPPSPRRRSVCPCPEQALVSLGSLQRLTLGAFLLANASTSETFHKGVFCVPEHFRRRGGCFGQAITGPPPLPIRHDQFPIV